MNTQPIRTATALCIALLALLALPGVVAAAPGHDSIALVVPKRVTQHKRYDVSIMGLALHKSKAYLFLDYARCASTYVAEKRIAVGEKPPEYTVSGAFTETSGWKTSLVEPGAPVQLDHACAYLVSPSTDRVLATAKATIQVH
jgi:hypothetical protein